MRGGAFLVVSVVLFWLAPVLGQREIAFAAAIALTLPLLALLLVAVRRPKLSVVRRFSPEIASAGTDCEVTLAIQNWGMAPTPAASWSDGAEAPLEPSPVAALPSLPAFRSLETDRPRVLTVRYLLRTPRRGRHTIGPLQIRLGDPFGLATRRISVGETDMLTVTPEVETLSRGSFRLPSGDGQSLQSRRLAGSGEQDVIARKYQTGDSMRRVHWPATARHSELMVRQDDQQNDHEAVIVLDNHLASYATASGRRADAASHDDFEWAVSMAASIGVHLIDEGYRTRLVDSTSRASDAGDLSLGGTSDLLLRGAHVHLEGDAPPFSIRDIVPDAGRVSGELPPVFAVLGNVDDESMLALARAAAGSSSALAFVVHRMSEVPPAWALSARDELENAGWTVRIVSPGESPSAAWESDAARAVR